MQQLDSLDLAVNLLFFHLLEVFFLQLPLVLVVLHSHQQFFHTLFLLRLRIRSGLRALRFVCLDDLLQEIGIVDALARYVWLLLLLDFL